MLNGWVEMSFEILATPRDDAACDRSLIYTLSTRASPFGLAANKVRGTPPLPRWETCQLSDDRVFDHRSRLCSSNVSSTRVAMVHTCPEGSITHPMRSPQN